MGFDLSIYGTHRIEMSDLEQNFLGQLQTRLMAEWEYQQAVLLAFPHIRSDWRKYIDEARKTFISIIKEILFFQKVIVCVDIHDEEGLELLAKLSFSNLEVVRLPLNDTWARDFGPISIQDINGNTKLLDFCFNGWGLKFASNFDNEISRKLHKIGILKDEMQTIRLVLEGGSIDTDGQGRLLTNTRCLLEANRNPALNQDEIEQILKEKLGIKKILWLHSGHLVGDDTDGHIDTLARFINAHTIAYMKCEDTKDEHYEALQKMETELLEFQTSEGKPYNLVPLPLPKPIFYENDRLPASYVNFLFINNALLVPTYGVEEDERVLRVLRNACPHIKVIGVDCSVLIRQHGSLHCVTMQLY